MTIRSFSTVLTILTLLVFCAQPVFAHCGKCGMGGETAPQTMESKHDCGCALRGKDHQKHQHGELKCAECEQAGHHGHHGSHEHGEDDSKLDDLFKPDPT